MFCFVALQLSLVDCASDRKTRRLVAEPNPWMAPVDGTALLICGHLQILQASSGSLLVQRTHAMQERLHRKLLRGSYGESGEANNMMEYGTSLTNQAGAARTDLYVEFRVGAFPPGPRPVVIRQIVVPLERGYGSLTTQLQSKAVL